LAAFLVLSFAILAYSHHCYRVSPNGSLQRKQIQPRLLAGQLGEFISVAGFGAQGIVHRFGLDLPPLAKLSTPKDTPVNPAATCFASIYKRTFRS
jgi:hypothetical protein